MKTKMLMLVMTVLLLGGVLLASVALAAEEVEPGGPELASIRQATVRYQNLQAALDDGYEPLFDCIVNPANPSQGAMGQHYINNSLVDGSLELTQPEVLMYEPLPIGKMKLVGVEYVIFEDSWTQPEPPEFLGQTLQRKTAVGTYKVPPFFELHVWVWKHNPNGILADWNPKVSCQYAAAQSE